MELVLLDTDVFSLFFRGDTRSIAYESAVMAGSAASPLPALLNFGSAPLLLAGVNLAACNWSEQSGEQ
jgi:hypothetical protein